MKKYMEQKQKYIFLLTLILIGVLSGIMFILFVSKADKQLIKEHLTLTFDTINDHRVNYSSTLLNNCVKNVLSLMFIYISGISIIGIPLILLYLFFKGFTFGFSISSIVSIYHYKGVFISFLYLLPGDFFLLIIWLLMGFYSINFSIKLFRYLFLKENIPLNIYFKKLNKILLISFISIIVISIIQTFLEPLIIDLCV